MEHKFYFFSLVVAIANYSFYLLIYSNSDMVDYQADNPFETETGTNPFEEDDGGVSNS